MSMDEKWEIIFFDGVFVVAFHYTGYRNQSMKESER